MTKKEKAAKIVKKLKELYPEKQIMLNYTQPYEFLFAVIMSAQTTDKQVNKVTKILFKKYKNLAHYAKADVNVFARDISSIGLYRSKAKNVVATAKILVEKYDGRVPDDFDELIKLPGVGRKTANVVLGVLYGKSVGIAVDTHVTRLAYKYGLTTHKDAKKVEQDLMKILPRSEWIEFTNLMIQYGREYCPARPHDCTQCPLWTVIRSSI